ncbi:hypothetical protein ACFQMA_24430 [Halosimplex aquaticum]|uniref:Halobacterial output domain-containing protein n=1 Tax=Halosimplex aquaticum TaxID=3026162 RepID=A0ABD5Y6T3_9EURY|nr:hypothetical protein [Halosimplex aquaticum]
MVTPNITSRVRISTGRADRLRAFICGHLPSGIDVEVVLTPAVKTAAVLPAEADALVRSDATELERQQAAQLLESVDAEFLILVTTDPAPIDRIPVNDQLTADHAHQFGLAFHELLHILKTAIGPIAELLESEIEPNHHQQVHDLTNIIEDGAIEREAIEGANFSDNAEIRLELTRRIHSQVPDDIPDGEQVRFSFWDAVTSALYEWAIYPTGITEVLLDEDDERILFASEADASGFDAVQEALKALARDALAIRSAERDDITHSHDKTASVRRAQLVVETWQSAILPLLETHSEASTQSPDQDNSGESDVDSDPSSNSESPETADSNSDPEQPIDEEAGGVHNGQPQLERSATDDPFQDVLSQPSITPDSLDEEREATPSPETSDSLDTGTSAPDSDETLVRPTVMKTNRRRPRSPQTLERGHLLALLNNLGHTSIPRRVDKPQ